MIKTNRSPDEKPIICDNNGVYNVDLYTITSIDCKQLKCQPFVLDKFTVRCNCLPSFKKSIERNTNVVYHRKVNMCEEDVKSFGSMRTTQQVFDNDNKDRCVEFCGLIVMQNMV